MANQITAVYAKVKSFNVLLGCFELPRKFTLGVVIPKFLTYSEQEFGSNHFGIYLHSWEFDGEEETFQAKFEVVVNGGDSSFFVLNTKNIKLRNGDIFLEEINQVKG